MNLATVGVLLYSLHVPNGGYNNVTPGVYAIADNGATVLAYHNSVRKQSLFLGYTAEWGRLSLTMGAVSGYGRVKPALVPGYAVTDNWRVTWIPNVPGTSSNVLSIAYEHRFR